MGHADGRCCIYVHVDADLSMASQVVEDSKVDYPAACNAVETLLVHEDLVTSGKIKQVVAGLVERGVELRCEEDVLRQLEGVKGAVRATDEDVLTEFLDLQIYIRSVKSFDEGSSYLGSMLITSYQSYQYILITSYRFNNYLLRRSRRKIPTPRRLRRRLLERIDKVTPPPTTTTPHFSPCLLFLPTCRHFPFRGD